MASGPMAGEQWSEHVDDEGLHAGMTLLFGKCAQDQCFRWQESEIHCVGSPASLGAATPPLRNGCFGRHRSPHFAPRVLGFKSPSHIDSVRRRTSDKSIWPTASACSF